MTNLPLEKILPNSSYFQEFDKLYVVRRLSSLNGTVYENKHGKFRKTVILCVGYLTYQILLVLYVVILIF